MKNCPSHPPYPHSLLKLQENLCSHLIAPPPPTHLITKPCGVSKLQTRLAKSLYIVCVVKKNIAIYS